MADGSFARIFLTPGNLNPALPRGELSNVSRAAVLRVSAAIVVLSFAHRKKAKKRGRGHRIRLRYTLVFVPVLWSVYASRGSRRYCCV